jgi:hypothetical protein
MCPFEEVSDWTRRIWFAGFKRLRSPLKPIDKWTRYGYNIGVKKLTLTNTHVRINRGEAQRATKKARAVNPEMDLSKLIRALIRKFLSGEVKL